MEVYHTLDKLSLEQRYILCLGKNLDKFPLKVKQTFLSLFSIFNAKFDEEEIDVVLDWWGFAIDLVSIAIDLRELREYLCVELIVKVEVGHGSCELGSHLLIISVKLGESCHLKTCRIILRVDFD